MQRFFDWLNFHVTFILKQVFYCALQPHGNRVKPKSVEMRSRQDVRQPSFDFNLLDTEKLKNLNVLGSETESKIYADSMPHIKSFYPPRDL